MYCAANIRLCKDSVGRSEIKLKHNIKIGRKNLAPYNTLQGEMCMIPLLAQPKAANIQNVGAAISSSSRTWMDI